MPEKMRALYSGGKTQFLNGVPARNLTEDDWHNLDDDHKQAVKDSGLYEVRSDAEMASTNSPRVTSHRAASPAQDSDAKPADASA